MFPFVRDSLICLFTRNRTLHCKSHASFSVYFSTSIREKLPANAPILSGILLHKHNLSPEAVSRVTSVLARLRHPQNSDSILSFFKECGFSNTHLLRILRYRPQILSANVDKVIKPKIKIFRELGFSADEIADFVSKHPSILFCSANKRIIPSLSLLKGLLGSDLAVAKAVKTSGWLLLMDLDKTLIANVRFLRSRGIPMEQIVSGIPKCPRFFGLNPEFMQKCVDKAVEMGVGSSRMLIHAARVVSSMSNENWELKLKTFRSLGFSEDDIGRVFRTVPGVFAVSERKIKEVTNFFLETGKYDINCILNSPSSLMYSIGERYKPRLQVLEILERRNLINTWPKFGTFYSISDANFYDKFVAPYFNEVGEVYNKPVIGKRKETS